MLLLVSGTVDPATIYRFAITRIRSPMDAFFIGETLRRRNRQKTRTTK